MAIAASRLVVSIGSPLCDHLPPDEFAGFGVWFSVVWAVTVCICSDRIGRSEFAFVTGSGPLLHAVKIARQRRVKRYFIALGCKFARTSTKGFRRLPRVNEGSFASRNFV